LTGDSLLHLIPHAFANHDHSDGTLDQESHNEGVYKGLGAVVGIYVFFIIEKIMQIRRARKEKQHRHDELNHEDIQLSHHEHHDENVKEIKPSVMSETLQVGSNANVQNSGNNKIYLNENNLTIHANKDLKYISKYLPNNKCGENIDHHDHENEIEHLHQHSHFNMSKIQSEPNNMNYLTNKNHNLDLTNKTIINNTNMENSIIENIKTHFSNTNNDILNTNNINEPLLGLKNTQKNNLSHNSNVDQSASFINKNACICVDDSRDPQTELSKLEKHSSEQTTTTVLDVDDVTVIKIPHHGHSHGHKYKVS
jgi:hypothetical protein